MSPEPEPEWVPVMRRLLAAADEWAEAGFIVLRCERGEARETADARALLAPYEDPGVMRLRMARELPAPYGAGPVDSGARVYLVAGMEDTYDATLVREEALLDAVLDMIWDSADNAPAADREFYAAALANPDNWCTDGDGRRYYLKLDMGEIGWVEAHLVNPRTTPGAARVQPDPVSEALGKVAAVLAEKGGAL